MWSSQDAAQLTPLTQTLKLHRLRFTESQNRRTAEVGKDFLNSFALIPLLKQEQQVAQNHVQMAFEDLRGGRLHIFSGQPVPVLSHPQSKVLPDVPTEPLVFHFMFIAPCPVSEHH